MGRTKKASAATESAQAQRGELNVGTDTSGALEASEGAVSGQIIGPSDESELLGCQEDEAVLQEGMLTEYAVSAERGLNLRAGPGLDAPIIAVLPFGAGVYAEGEPMGGWLYVHTGRLEGWMVAAYLDPLPLPELVSGDI